MVLVITLLISVVITLFLAAAIQLLPTLGHSTVNLHQREQSLQAAQSGLDYARSRLQADPLWRGDDNGLVVDTPEFKVLEDNGNVFGFLTPSDGPPSHFRLRFNFQNDGDPIDDDLPNPAFPIDTEFVCFNNLGAAVTKEQLRAHPVGGSWVIDEDSPVVGNIPRFTASVIVEGYSGRAVESISPSNPLPAQGLRNSTRTILEAYFSRPGFLAVDSAVMAAANFDAMLLARGKMTIKSDENSTPARVRTLEKMEVYSDVGSADYEMDPNGEVIVDLGQDFILNGASSTTPTADQQSETEQAPHWLKLSYDDVTRAQPSDPNVRAGTYVWRTGGVLEYYPEEYTGTMPSGSGTIINSGDDMLSSGSGAIDLTHSNFRMRIQDNVYVEPQGSVTGFSVIAEDGLIAGLGQRPETFLNDVEEEGVIFTNDNGSVFIEGRIDGGGAVTAAGNITFQGTSTLEAEPDMAVALYSKGDINLLAIPDEVIPGILSGLLPAGGGGGKGKGGKGKGGGWNWNPPNGPPGGGGGFQGSPFNGANDVAFGGIIFAQGNFNVDLQQVNAAGILTGSQHGRFFLEGILATYGGDPETDNAPGQQAGQGLLNMKAADAVFIYDPDYLDSMVSLDSPARLEKSFWTTL